MQISLTSKAESKSRQRNIKKKTLKRPKSKAGTNLQSWAWRTAGKVPSGELCRLFQMNWQVCCGHYVLSVQKWWKWRKSGSPPAAKAEIDLGGRNLTKHVSHPELLLSKFLINSQRTYSNAQSETFFRLIRPLDPGSLGRLVTHF